jgi:hypothetical protein
MYTHAVGVFTISGSVGSFLLETSVFISIFILWLRDVALSNWFSEGGSPGRGDFKEESEMMALQTETGSQRRA